MSPSFLLLGCIPSVLGQWGMLPSQQQMMPQFPGQAQFPGQGYPQGGMQMGIYSTSPFDSRGGSPIIRPSVMGFGYPQEAQLSPFQQFPPQQSQFPVMAGVPNVMPGMGGMSSGVFPGGFPQGPQGMQPMGQPLEFGRPFGQFQSDSKANDIEKPVSPLEPTRIIPPFLKNASPQLQDQFYAIVQNPVWSPSEKQAKIEEFVRNMDVNAQNTFAEFQRASSSDTESKRQKVHKVVDEMSQEAQVQFQKVSALMTNPTLNEKERLTKIQDLYAKIPDNIKKEFDEKLANL